MGPEEGEEDGSAPWELGTGFLSSFYAEGLILSKSGQVWGKENAELLGRRVLQGRLCWIPFMS